MTVRNTDTATVTLRFTWPDGSSGLGSNPSYAVAAGDTRLVYLPSLEGLAAGDYALRVLSSQPISVVANAVLASNSASTGYGAPDANGSVHRTGVTSILPDTRRMTDSELMPARTESRPGEISKKSPIRL